MGDRIAESMADGTPRPLPGDERLLAAVARVFAAYDPAPELVDDLARAAFLVRDLDAELIPLVESAATTAVRGEDDQWVSFALDGLEIDLGSRRARHGWELVGQVTGGVREMAVQTMAGAEPVNLDAHGRFRVAVSARTWCLRLVTADGRPLRTQWVSL